MGITTARQIIRLELPEELAQKYEIQAHGAPLGDFLAHRLAETLDYDAKHGIYLRDADHNELTKLLGRNFATTEELMAIVRNGVTIRVHGADVLLDQTLLKRCQSRADVERVTLGEWLAREAILGLERTCGLR